jgi:LPXTG-motif cell wall-anchored protein
VFNYPSGYGQAHLTALAVAGTGSSGSSWTALAIGAPAAAVLAAGGYLWTRRRRVQPGRP